jgi:CrcB protein
MHKTLIGQLVLVGLGGFIGSASRYALAGWSHRLLPATVFPLGTLAVNVVGCFAIGALGGLMEIRQVVGPGARLFIMIGILGGFTTYSTFAYETLGLLHAAAIGKSILNICLHVALGLAAAWAGYALVQSL